MPLCPSGSPISTPSHSPLPRTSTASTPVHAKQSSSSVLNNPYIIVDKPSQVISMGSSAAASTGAPLPLFVRTPPFSRKRCNGEAASEPPTQCKSGWQVLTLQHQRSWTGASRLYRYFGRFVLFRSPCTLFSFGLLPSISLLSLFCSQIVTFSEPAGWLLEWDDSFPAARCHSRINGTKL